MSDDRTTLFALKEKAKWSSDLEEKKAVIKKISTHGEDAISELQEIMNTTAYEQIRNACAEAIKSMLAKSSSSKAKGNINGNDNNGSSSISSNNDNSGISGASQRSGTVDIMFDSAREYYASGDYKKADIFFEKVLDIDPNHINALTSSGILLQYKLAGYDKARTYFEKVLQVDPRNIIALNSI